MGGARSTFLFGTIWKKFKVQGLKLKYKKY
jgi:hypothetical protein